MADESLFIEKRYTTPAGLTLAAHVGGRDDAPTVLLLHGGGQTRHSWTGAMNRLVREGYRVISYDARGHGESDWSPDGDYTLPALAGDLMTVLADVHAPAALVGASMGGMTSFYAIGSTDRKIADALVMVDIVLRPAAEGAAKIQQFMRANPGGFANVEEAADAVAAYNPDRPRPSDPSGLRRNLRLREDGRLHWHWDPRLLQTTPSSEPPAFTKEMVRVAPHVTVPTLLVRGGRSDIVDDAGLEEMKRLVPQTEVYLVPAAGHMVAGDRNDAFNDGVITFLKRTLPLHGRA